MQIKTESIATLPEAARKFIDAMRGHRIFLLYGSMGAGKTTFVAEVCRQLGVEEGEVCSPTFAIVNEYSSSLGPIYHFDLYRLENAGEVADMGAEEYFNSGALCFVEWPETAEEFIPEDAVKVTIEEMADGSRIISLPD